VRPKKQGAERKRERGEAAAQGRQGEGRENTDCEEHTPSWNGKKKKKKEGHKTGRKVVREKKLKLSREGTEEGISTDDG